MAVSFVANTRRGFGSIPQTINAPQIVRIIESTSTQRADVRAVSVSTIPGLFALKQPSISSVLPLWIFRGASSDNLSNIQGIGIAFDTADPQAMPLQSSIYPSLEVLYLGYVQLQNVNGGTLRFPRGSLMAQGGQFLAVITTTQPVDLTLTPPATYSDPVVLSVMGTKEPIGDIRRPSAAGKYLASLPRY